MNGTLNLLLELCEKPSECEKDRCHLSNDPKVLASGAQRKFSTHWGTSNSGRLTFTAGPVSPLLSVGVAVTSGDSRAAVTLYTSAKEPSLALGRR